MDTETCKVLTSLETNGESKQFGLSLAMEMLDSLIRENGNPQRFSLANWEYLRDEGLVFYTNRASLELAKERSNRLKSICLEVDGVHKTLASYLAPFFDYTTLRERLFGPGKKDRKRHIKFMELKKAILEVWASRDKGLGAVGELLRETLESLGIPEKDIQHKEDHFRFDYRSCVGQFEINSRFFQNSLNNYREVDSEDHYARCSEFGGHFHHLFRYSEESHRKVLDVDIAKKICNSVAGYIPWQALHEDRLEEICKLSKSGKSFQIKYKPAVEPYEDERWDGILISPASDGEPEEYRIIESTP